MKLEKKTALLILGLCLCGLAVGAITYAVTVHTITVNMGSGTAITAASVTITSASFNATDASPTIASGGQSVTFSSWQYTIGDTDVLSITLTNSGGTSASLGIKI